MPHATPSGLLGGFGGKSKISRVLLRTKLTALNASSGFSLIHLAHNPKLPDIKGELSPQSKHFPNFFTAYKFAGLFLVIAPYY
jgi:hypothetical protein